MACPMMDILISRLIGLLLRLLDLLQSGLGRQSSAAIYITIELSA